MAEQQQAAHSSGEIGRVKTSRLSRMSDDNPLLRHPNSVITYNKMVREDAQISSIIRAITLPILRTTWRLDPAGADEDITRMVAEDLRLPVIGQTSDGESRGRVSWQEHLQYALQMLIFGHAYFEKVYEAREDGRTHLRKLAVRPQETIARVNVALDGGLESITQKAFYDGQEHVSEIDIPVERLLAYVYEDRTKSWLGESVLRPAFTPWVYKNDIIEIERIAIERTGVGLPVYTSSEDDDQEDIDFGQDLVESLRAGQTSGASIRHNAKLEVRGVSGQVYPAGEAIQRYNAEIAKAVLAHALNLDGKGGSYALADIQMGLFIQSLQTIATHIAEVATHYLIEEMVFFYTGERDAKAPKLVFDEIGMKSALTSSQVAELVNAGVILTDSTLDEHMRRQGGLPPKQAVEDWAEERAKRNEILGTQEEQSPGGENA